MTLKHRIALLSDIHGNIPALNAVLHDIKGNDVEEIIVAGDMVGRGPQGDEVVKELRRVTNCFIGGNHEEYLVNFRRKNVPSEWLSAPEWSASRWMAAELSSDSYRFIQNIPFSTTSRVISNLRIVHGSPASNREGIGPWTSPERISQFFSMIEETILICAHTHRPFYASFNEGTILNIGSVGLPFNRDQRAHYIWLESDGENISIIDRFIEYDLNESIQVYLVSGLYKAGKIVSELLAIELRDACSTLVPFERWLREHNLAFNEDSLKKYLSINQIERIRWENYQ